MKKFLSLEELEVDKVARIEEKIDDNSDSENLVMKVQATIDTNKKDNTDSKESEDDQTFEKEADQSSNNDDTGAMSAGTDKDSDEAQNGNMVNASGGESDLANGQESIIESVQILMAMEDMADIALEDFRDIAAGAVSGVASSFAYLKNIGIEYGPGLFKAIGKTAIYALSMALKGMYLGSKALTESVDNSINSYKALYKRLDNIKETIAVVEKAGATDNTNGEKYTNKRVIFGISNRREFTPYEALTDYDIFISNFVAPTTEKTDSALQAIRMLSAGMMTGRLSDPEKIMDIRIASAGLSIGPVAGYKAPSDLVDVYHYSKALPGHITLLAYLPKKDLKKVSDIYTAYHQSQYFFGYNIQRMSAQTEVPFLGLSDIKKLFAKVNSVANNSESILAQLKNLQTAKDRISITLKSVIAKIDDNVNRTKVRSRILQFIALKMYFIQKCYSKSMIAVDKQNRKILFNYCRYMEASLLNLAKSKK